MGCAEKRFPPRELQDTLGLVVINFKKKKDSTAANTHQCRAPKSLQNVFVPELVLLMSDARHLLRVKIPRRAVSLIRPVSDSFFKFPNQGT